MELSAAIALIREGIEVEETGPQTWADLGAGAGLFSRALGTLLPSKSTIYAVDQDGAALNTISWKHPDKTLIRINSDINDPLELPPLDGALLANVLHYLNNQSGFIQRLGTRLRDNGVLIIIEYDTTTANPWVPYPISFDGMKKLAAGLHSDLKLLGTVQSKFNTGNLYSVQLQLRHR